MQPEQARSNFSLLQIYRGWAAMLVVLFHTTAVASEQFAITFLGNHFDMGSAGVDFFFVLSGFLITHIHLKDIGRRERLGKYLHKRFVRIYPAYWIVTLAILPFYWIVPGWGQGDEKTVSVIAGSFLLLPMLRGPILTAGWTLCHEMLFYLIFALLIFGPVRLMVSAALVWALGVIIATAVFFHGTGKFDSAWTQLFFWPQNLEFLLGCAAALIASRPVAGSLPSRWCIALLAAGLCAFAMIGALPVHWDDLSSGKHVVLYGTLSFVIVLCSALLEKKGAVSARLTGSLSYRLMTRMGDASYSIYLCHGPIISLTFKAAKWNGLAGEHAFVAAVAAVFLSAIGGWVFHVLAEKPLLDWMRPRR